MTDLPIQHFPLESGHPRPRLAHGSGQCSDPDEAFNLCQRVYPPDVSISDPPASSSSSSIRLLAAEEGGNLDPHGPLPNGMYGVDTQYSYERMPYHIGIDPLWYDPGRGSRYGAYPQYILPPPFDPHCYLGHPNEPPHLQVGAMGHRHYTNPPPPLCGLHATENTPPSGDHDPSAKAHRQAPPYNQMSSGVEAGPGPREGTSQEAITRCIDKYVCHLSIFPLVDAELPKIRAGQWQWHAAHG